jgi:hypothetical protein
MPRMIIVDVLILISWSDFGCVSIWFMSLFTQPDDHLVYTGGQLGGRL